MKEIVNRCDCTGCTTCLNSCPKKAIKFIEDEEGFKIPFIDQAKCIDCGICKKVCPVLISANNKPLKKCYVGYSNNQEDRLNASSGSLFSVIASYVLENKGIVVGATLDEKNIVKHIAIEKKKELEKLKKSKYVQSDLGSIFSYIKETIKKKKVLFVGTPCQVAGLKSFIKEDSNLITIDLICHGVPSPKVFEKYVSELESSNNDKLVDYDFRDNSTGWKNFSNRADFKSTCILTSHKKNTYMKLFLSNIDLRESCYNCHFRLDNKYSDITLGDFWGVEKHYPEMYNAEGVSAIILNTALGNTIFDEVKSKLEYKECNLEEIIESNSPLVKSVTRPKARDRFYKELDSRSLDFLANKYAKKHIVKRIKNKVKSIFKK